MSLNREQRERTSRELHQNFELSGLGAEDLAERVSAPVAATRAALDVENADPALVWHVRDALEAEVRAQGKEPIPFTVLSEDQRAAARGWFGI